MPAQHVENLRQLVDAQFPDHGADARDARVRLLRPLRLAVALRVRAHAAKFEHAEAAASEADACLPIEYRRTPTVFELDRERREYHDR